MLKPQDIVVVLRLALERCGERTTFQTLSTELGMSVSEVHASVQRAVESSLVDAGTRSVNRSNLLEFLVHGVRYVFPAKHSPLTRGVPTGYAAPPLGQHFSISETPPVWPFAEGSTRGEGLEPLYRSVPGAALKNPLLHEWLALVDAIRAGRARERALAVKELTKRLSG